MPSAKILNFLGSQAWAMQWLQLEQARTILTARAMGIRTSPADLAALQRSSAPRKGGAARVERELAFDDDDANQKPHVWGFDGLECVVNGADNGIDSRPLHIERGPVTIVPCHGMFAKYASMVHGISSADGMSTNRLCEAIRSAILLTTTQYVVLDIDSPGGTVAGMADVIDLLRSNREGKVRPDGKRIPVIAYIHDLGASGGYLLASWADEIYCGPSSKVGYMGVYRVLVDSSAAANDEGIACEIIASQPAGGNPTVKGAGEPGTPVTQEMRAAAQQEINALGVWFKDTLAEGRGEDPDYIDSLCTGRGWVGQQAVAMRLADGVTSLPELVQQLTAAAMSGQAS